MKKYTRQMKILELIQNYEIETQEELADYLKKSGIDVTQATVSRDIRELRIVKTLSSSGKYKYAAVAQNQEGTTDRLIRIFKNSVTSIDVAGHLLVMKTLPGAAQVSASAIDALNVDGVIGTIAGDDTIFVAINSSDRINEVLDKFKRLLD